MRTSVGGTRAAQTTGGTVVPMLSEELCWTGFVSAGSTGDAGDVSSEGRIAARALTLGGSGRTGTDRDP